MSLKLAAFESDSACFLTQSRRSRRVAGLFVPFVPFPLTSLGPAREDARPPERPHPLAQVATGTSSSQSVHSILVLLSVFLFMSLFLFCLPWLKWGALSLGNLSRIAHPLYK